MKSNITLPALGLCLALAATFAQAQTVTDVIPKPGAMQPGGDPNDTTLRFGKWWGDNGSVTEDFDTSMHSSNNIAGSIHVVFDCWGNSVLPPKSANLAFGNFLDNSGDNGWLGAGNKFDASKYESLSFDININTAGSSNTVIPITLYGAGYGNVNLTNLPITTSGWQHLVIPIPSSINLADCTAYGVYDWYNTTDTTPPAHVEYWIDNVLLKARVAPIPPPTLSLQPVTQRGLLMDSALGEGGQRGAIDTIADVRFASAAQPSAPVTYAMTIGSIPDPTVYSNYEAHIFLAPDAGVGNPDWNSTDMGYLQILTRNDGTAIARMMWKTNNGFDNRMLFNQSQGGDYGTNGYAAGTLGYLTAPTIVGTWSITFTSDLDFTVRGPGGVSTNLTLPQSWLDSYNGTASFGAVHAYFGGGPNGNNNSGQFMTLTKVSVTSVNGGYAYTNDFTKTPLDSQVWGLLGNETVQVLPGHDWWVNWTLPAAGFDLYTKDSLAPTNRWQLLSGNTNLAIPFTIYTSGTNSKALFATANSSKTGQSYFAARKLLATKLQVLLPGETNAPYTLTGKTGTPSSIVAGLNVTATVNAVDADWNIVTSCADNIHITCSDSMAAVPPDAKLANGTGSFSVGLFTTGPQTITAADLTTPAVTSATTSQISVTSQ